MDVDRIRAALAGIDGLTVHGPVEARDRAPLVSFTVDGMSPFALAEALDREDVDRATQALARIVTRSYGTPARRSAAAISGTSSSPVAAPTVTA